MSWHSWILLLLLGLSTLLLLLSAFAIAVMSDSYQRLHFSSIVVGLSAPLLAFAVWIETQNVQARIKVTLIVLLLFITNGILSHATGRACRVKTRGHWRLEDQDYDIALGETDQ